MSIAIPRAAVVGVVLTALVLPGSGTSAGGLLENLGHSLEAALHPPNFRASFHVAREDVPAADVAARLAARIDRAGGSVHDRKSEGRIVIITGWLPGGGAPGIGALATDPTVTLHEVLDGAADRQLRTLAARDGEPPAGVRLEPDFHHRTDGPRLTAESDDMATLKAFLADHPNDAGAWRVGATRTRDGVVWKAYLLGPKVVGTEHVRGAAGELSPHGTWHVTAALDDEGRTRFADLTERVVGARVAIVVDGEVESAPVVQERITGGRIWITMGGGDDSEGSARDLAACLATPLPSPVELIAVETIGR